MRHFLAETDFSPTEVEELFLTAQDFKANRLTCPPVLDRQTWGLLFFKNSTRTRVSFEVGIGELGGRSLMLNTSATQLSRGESIADTARVLSRYLHGLVIRCSDHAIIEEFAADAGLPVINALTDLLHPCQAYADYFSMAEKWAENGDYLSALKGRKLAFLGDTSSNMANSLAMAGAIFGVEVTLGGPAELKPGDEINELLARKKLDAPCFTVDPMEAVRNADVVYTDVWVSMGDEDESARRKEILPPYQVSADIMATAKPEALFMHCLPAHAGQEVTQEVLDSRCSIIFDQAENRLHVQKAILAAL